MNSHSPCCSPSSSKSAACGLGELIFVLLDPLPGTLCAAEQHCRTLLLRPLVFQNSWTARTAARLSQHASIGKDCTLRPQLQCRLPWECTTFLLADNCDKLQPQHMTQHNTTQPSCHSERSGRMHYHITQCLRSQTSQKSEYFKETFCNIKQQACILLPQFVSVLLYDIKWNLRRRK